MEKQITVLPVYVEQIKEVITQHGNTKQVLLSLIQGTTKSYMKQYPKMSQDDAINQAYDIIVNAYELLNIELPVR